MLTGAVLPVLVGRVMEGAKALLSKDATGAELRLGTPGMRDSPPRRASAEGQTYLFRILEMRMDFQA